MLVRSKSNHYITPVQGMPLPDIEEDESSNSSLNGSSNLAFAAENSFLNHLHSKDSYQTITSDELAILLKEKSFMNHVYDSVSILDARFDYEFNGGRISGAQNVYTRDEITVVYDSLKGGNMCIVFHCEFSQNRGPTLMKLFRKHDRQQNIKTYPKLKFPHLFLLKDGYKQFYFDHPECCIGGYVPMREPRYVLNGQLKRCHSNYTKNMLLSFEEANNHFLSSKNPMLSILSSKFNTCSQTTSLDSFSICGKRSISLPAIHNPCSQTLTFPDVPTPEQTLFHSSSKALTPICCQLHFTFSQQTCLSPSPNPLYACSNTSNSVDSSNPDELKSTGYENLSEFFFPI